MATAAATTQVPARKTKATSDAAVDVNLTPLKIYLLIYNVASLAAWGYILALLTEFILKADHPAVAVQTPSSAFSILAKLLPASVLPTSSSSLVGSRLPAPLSAAVNHLKGSYNYKNIGLITTVVQSFAVLEIIHAALGWVRSDVVTVAMQVSSRLWSIWGIVETFPHIAQNHPLYTTMVYAWSVAEVIRYSFYALALVGIQPKALNWLRYTAFYILYPIGAGSEAFLSFATLPPFTTLLPIRKLVQKLPISIKKKIAASNFGHRLLGRAIKSAVTGPGVTWDAFAITRLVLFFAWWPALHSMFSHMQRQRRKVFGRGRTLNGVPKVRKAQ